MDPPGAQVEITPRRMCCPAHCEHFRANWPTGFLVFGVKAFQKATENPKMWEACRQVAGLSPIEQIPVETINLVTKTRPFCYFLERSDILALLAEAGTLKEGKGDAWLRHQRCDICGIPRLSGAYSINNDGEIQTNTVCIECACDAGDRMHEAFPNGAVWS